MSTPAPSFVDLAHRLKLPTDLWDYFEWQLMCGLRVCCPGIIKSFDSIKQTVQVQLAIRENILQNLVSTPVAIAPLVDVPIVIPRAGGYALTLPVTAGDECLVVFGDMCIDGWWASGGIQNQLDRRRHDLSDGFAVIGVWNQRQVLSNYSTTTAALRSDDGNTVIEVGNNLVVVQARNVTIQGSTEVDILSSNLVNINGAGHTTIEGKDFLTHKHTGISTGGGTSGPVL